MVNSKRAFWQAFLFTLIVFVFGLFLGFMLESFRADSFQTVIANSEVNVLDKQILFDMLDNNNLSCEHYKMELFQFADEVYFEALKLEKEDSASKFSNRLEQVHRRYDLLRFMILNKAHIARSTCESNFHVIGYFYQYKSNDISVISNQDYYSRLLYDLKANHPEDLLLIPVATDMDLDSIDLFVSRLNISDRTFILIDNNKLINDFITLEDLENVIFEYNN